MFRRVKQLEDEGYIEKYVALLNQSKIEFKFNGICADLAKRQRCKNRE